MHTFNAFFERRSTFAVTLAVVVTVFFAFAVVNAATTISTDVTTAGNIYATSTLVIDGTATFNGNTTIGNAAGDTLTITANASTSNALTVAGDFFVSGNATTTASSGNFDTEGTISIASSTPSEQLNVTGDVSVGSAATTTVFVDSTTASTGGCLQMRGADGTLYRAYIMSTSTGDVAEWRIDAGTCQ